MIIGTRVDHHRGPAGFEETVGAFPEGDADVGGFVPAFAGIAQDHVGQVARMRTFRVRQPVLSPARVEVTAGHGEARSLADAVFVDMDSVHSSAPSPKLNEGSRSNDVERI